MKGDFTRRTFRRGHHYRAVLLQQGRVAVDADWNEQAEIQQHLDETTARDVIGAHGAASGTAGFAVSTGPDGPVLSAGHYYVDGVLCENDADTPVGAQPDLPGVALPADEGRYVLYLDVFREHLTALERPALREVALGGPDTATRSRTVWQARFLRVDDPGIRPADVAAPWTPPGAEVSGRLRARAEPGTPGDGPSLIPPAAGYRRLENQLYRVEIHAGGTFLWSRDNGSVAARLIDVDGDTLHLDSPGHAFSRGDLVEITDLGRTRRGEPGLLTVLGEVTGTALRTTTPVAFTASEGAIVRRWDSADALPITDGWIPIEDGVEVSFDPDGTYRTGDHWLIPARTAALDTAESDLTGDVEWPRDDDGTPAYRPPDGVHHTYAAIALLDLRDDIWNPVGDCRALWAPLTLARPDPPAPKWPAGLHLERVRLARTGDDLRNDTTIRLHDLLGGITLTLDGPIAPVGAAGTAVCTITLDLPFPDTGIPVGSQPLTIAATVSTDGRDLRWTPSAAFAAWLPRTVLDAARRGHDTRMLGRLTVIGRAVRHADHPARVLNGLALSRFRPSDNGTDLVLPTVDDVRGADFTMWFWIDLLQGALFDDSASTFDSSRLFW
ncbi:DUF6519 domain-containing protein [Catenuloplanes japonicus]|uniref:DUF6519 domain-containing protein n=1 Tax=Catenuloplanes japonicus TaxID=33876 RepID=UPI00068C529B|nr:DUF6519 domain-containing protein [Catenuloplanes japonicus]